MCWAWVLQKPPVLDIQGVFVKLQQWDDMDDYEKKEINFTVTPIQFPELTLKMEDIFHKV